MKKTLRLVSILAVLGAALFAATIPAQAGGWTCMDPMQTYWETYIHFPQEDGYFWDIYCQKGDGTSGALGETASMNLFNGFVSATIDGIPGVSFKAFLYTHWHLQPETLPEGWHRYGYGVDIFYDNGSVNPSGFVCFSLPEGVAENLEVGVFSFKNGDYTRLSDTGCGYFEGGGTFFLLIKDANPSGFFTPPFP